MSKLIALVCPQCGGKLETDESHVRIFTEGDSATVMLRTSAGTLTCAHCGTHVAPGSELSLAPGQAVTMVAQLRGSGAIAQGPGARAVGAGGVYIGGSRKGSIITGEGNYGPGEDDD